LPSEISKRNTHSQVPLVIEYEFKDCWNLTLIDTPDLMLGVTDIPKGVDAETLQNEGSFACHLFSLLLPCVGLKVAVFLILQFSSKFVLLIDSSFASRRSATGART
jgi:hypothetical protein